MAYEKAIELNPQFVEAWTDKGNAFDELGRHIKALTCYDMALEINPQFADAWYNKGIALERAGLYAEAEAAFAKARLLGHKG